MHREISITLFSWIKVIKILRIFIDWYIIFLHYSNWQDQPWFISRLLYMHCFNISIVIGNCQTPNLKTCHNNQAQTPALPNKIGSWFSVFNIMSIQLDEIWKKYQGTSTTLESWFLVDNITLTNLPEYAKKKGGGWTFNPPQNQLVTYGQYYKFLFKHRFR